MTNELVMQEVEFNGDTLVAVRSPENNKVYVGVKWVCEGVGLTNGQSRRQVENLSEDIVLSKGVANLRLPTNGGIQEVLCVELDFLPLWLAKISITPKMKQDSPDVVENLIEYQLKAKDVLAKVFVEKVSYIVPQSYEEALEELLESVKEKNKLKEKVEYQKPMVEFHDNVNDSKGADSLTSVAKSFGIGRNKFSMFLKCTGILFNEDGHNVPYQHLQDQGYFKVTMKPYSSSDGYSVSYKTIVTGKGKTYLHKIVQKYGGSKVISELTLKEIPIHINETDIEKIS